jgi:hypothetical protein
VDSVTRSALRGVVENSSALRDRDRGLGYKTSSRLLTTKAFAKDLLKKTTNSFQKNSIKPGVGKKIRVKSYPQSIIDPILPGH